MTRLHKCFAIDYSGSTWNDKFYHSNVRFILDSKLSDEDEIIIWDSESKYISKERYMEINRSLDGNGGTYPKCIFDAMFSKHNDVHYSEFILISDGQIYDGEVEDLDKRIQEYTDKFKCDYCEVYLLGSGANLSVACPFTRFNASKTIVKSSDNDEKVISVSDEDLKTINEIDNINTLEEFNLKYESLKKAFIARFIGTDGDKELRKSVLLMHKRINANNSKKEDNKNEIIDKLVIEDKNYEAAKTEAIKCFGSVLGGDFQSQINLLIRMCDGGLKQMFDMNELQTFQSNIANDTEVNEVDDIQDLNIESSVSNSNWECPISIENEVDPMILITSNSSDITPILIGFDKVTTEKIINCPLNALYIPEFIEKFKSYVDHCLSLKNYRSSLTTSNPIQTSPITRKKIIGAIPLGENAEHVKASNWTLMKIITGGKDLGDKNLWFFVLYMMIKNGTLPYLKDIEDYVKAQVIYRFMNYQTSISLSGLSNLPQTKVLYPTAAWTCLVSPFLIPKIPNKLNLFYVHLGHYRELIEMIKLFNLELPKEFEKYATRVEILSRLLTFFKRNPKLLYMYRNGIQNSTTMVHIDENSVLKSTGVSGDVFIPIDGEINKDEQLQCLKKFSIYGYNCIQEGRIDIEDICWLMKFIDVQKNLTDLDVPTLIKGRNEKDGMKKSIKEFWKEWDDNVDKFNVKISEKTCRPYYYVKGGLSWYEVLGKIVDINKPILSLDKYFGTFVETYGVYPNKDEYIYYLYRRVCLGSSVSSTLPKNIRKFCDQVFQRYNDIMTKYSPSQFTYRFQNNVSIIKRMANE